MVITTAQRKLFLILNTAFLTLICMAMILPFLHIISVSFSNPRIAESGLVGFWPKKTTLQNYKVVFHDALFKRSFLNSVFITTVGTFVNLVLTSLFAYPLSRQELVFRRHLLLMVLFTFVFPAPLIPQYLVVRNLGLLDTYWALIVPYGISTFNFFVLHSFFSQLPGELIDSARVDGTSETRILLQIVIPLSMAAMATLGLFYAVTHWNSYFHALMFINTRKLIPIQVRLREIIVHSDFIIGAEDENMSPYALRMTTILIAALPILCVYPFLQKYFVKGVTLGSLKG